jgi:xanthine dehydrogenase iron-sulfur cluster and FAD-binding subunit A
VIGAPKAEAALEGRGPGDAPLRAVSAAVERAVRPVDASRSTTAYSRALRALVA